MGPVSSREAVNSGNYTPIVNIVTWILLVSMVFAVCTKVAMKIIGRRTFNIDDSILVAAMVSVSALGVLSSLKLCHLCYRRSALHNPQLSVYKHITVLGVLFDPLQSRKWRGTRRSYSP